MRNLLSKLWKDDAGFLISTEMLFIAVLLILGLIAGWAAVRAALITEYVELAGAIIALNESYTWPSVSVTSGGNAGSTAIDASPATPIVVNVDTAGNPPAGGYVNQPYSVDYLGLIP